MAAYTDDQWDQVLENAENSGVWSDEDTEVLRGLLNSSHTFGLHFLAMILDQRKVGLLALVAQPMLSQENIMQVADFKGQIKGVDSILALIRLLAEKEPGNALV
jgi:hypothetical protein